jgi:hypothetical protein
VEEKLRKKTVCPGQVLNNEGDVLLFSGSSVCCLIIPKYENKLLNL